MSEEPKALTGLLTWERVDVLVDKIKAIGPWYIHSPLKGMDSLFVVQGAEASEFLAGLTRELKARPHGAGWVYVHTPKSPSWVKIYDPAKCGSSCSTTTPPAWWEMALKDPRPTGLPKSSPEKKGLFSRFMGS
ncbi:MAG: hypothetical protein R3231_05435 [bacterium]|nr:hypothetical protein [bacterium]